MSERLTPDGKLACRSCDANWPMPARYYAHPKLNDGSKGEVWPVCLEHMQWAMVAGWFPINEIGASHIKEGSSK
jgi:hypothetical protein